MKRSLNGFLVASWPALVLGAVLSACGLFPPEEGERGDPCEPHGHIHRDPRKGDWCHCGRGYLARESPLACVRDPNYDPSKGFTFGDEGMSACWRLGNTEPVTVAASAPGAPTINRFDTVYRIELPAGQGEASRTVTYDSAGTGDFVIHLGKAVPLTVVEEGKGPLTPLAQKEATVCEGFRHMVGLEFAEGVRYSLTVGPTAESEIHLLIEQLP
jgi:hypothetical protein